MYTDNVVSQHTKAFLRNLLPRRIRPYRILRGPLRGVILVTSWQHNFSSLTGRTEQGIISWIHRNVRPAQTWLDIGANYGYITLALSRQVGSDGRVFSFEPKLSTCGYLSQTVQMNGLANVTVVPLALGTGKDLVVSRFATLGSMAVASSQPDHLVETVIVCRLDSLWPKICGGKEQIDGVKIDVQGMEIDTLAGMQQLLRTYKPSLILEFHKGVDRLVIQELLQSCGYHARGTPVTLTSEERDGPLYHDNSSYVFCRESLNASLSGPDSAGADNTSPLFRAQ